MKMMAVPGSAVRLVTPWPSPVMGMLRIAPTTTWPKPMVAMAKKIPDSRNTGRPMGSETSAAAIPPTNRASRKGRCRSSPRSTDT